ncbi:MAG TPA: SLC13 family permease [bacterium]|nr:SLC13 family permease [bacterium]
MTSHHSIAVLTVFAATYAGIAVGRVPGLKVNRAGIALLGAIGMMVLAGVPTAQVVDWVNWPMIALLFGFFVISAQLRLSGFYDRAAHAISRRLDRPAFFLLALMAAAAGLSAFLNHDIVCLAFTPVVAQALLRERLDPVPFLVALALAGNIGAAATLIGNPQDMLIGETAHLKFGAYMLWSLPPVLASLGAAYGIVWSLSRQRLRTAGKRAVPPKAPEYPYDRAHTLKGLVILVLAVGLFFTSIPKEITALAAAGIHLASRKFRTEDLLGRVDWEVLVLFMGLFAVTGAFQSTGYGDAAVAWLAREGFDLGRPLHLILAAAGLSNLINNSAAVMFLLKVVDLSKPATAYTLALANSFGGSLLIAGSVSNLIVAQQARAMGVRLSFQDFAKLGVPVTLASLALLGFWVAWAG